MGLNVFDQLLAHSRQRDHDVIDGDKTGKYNGRGGMQVSTLLIQVIFYHGCGDWDMTAQSIGGEVGSWCLPGFPVVVRKIEDRAAAIIVCRPDYSCQFLW